MLEVSHLGCVRSEQFIFSELTFSLQPGFWIWVKGSNGSGKTSLLQILSGLRPKAAGEIFWQTQTMKRWDVEFLSQMFYLGHQPPLNLSLTPLENLQWWARLRSNDRCCYDTSDIIQVLKELQLNAYLNVTCDTLSFGQRQRVSLARLKLQKAVFWLLDEPFTGLDDDGKQWVRDTLQNHLKHSGFFMMASHEPLLNFDKPSVVLELNAL